MVNKVNKFAETQNLASVLNKSLFLLLIVLLLCGCRDGNIQSVNDNFVSVRIGGAVIRVEVAENLEDQIKGLSGRKSLEENNGMLFVYNDMKVRDFWMKDMKFSLDIIFIKDNIIVDLVENLLAPESGEDLLSYTSKKEANYVLEVNAGFVGEYGIEVGDKVDVFLE